MYIKNLLNKTYLLFFTLIITSINYAQVNSDFDKSTDFSKYKTVSFGGWEKESDKLLSDFDKKRISDALTNEFNLRGIQFVDSDADATITLFIVIKEKSNITAYTNFNSGMGYRGRWGYGRGYGMGTASTSVDKNDYREGTLVIDMYDTKEKTLIWQGDMTTEVKEQAKKREKSIPKNMRKLMKKFPVSKI